jgi:diacylglycerol kinase (ATP)
VEGAMQDSGKNLSFARRLRFALAGVAHALSTERSVRTQAVFFLLVVVALIVLRPAAVWWALVFLASAAVLAAELFNTAIEHLADHLHPGSHPSIRIVKDCAAAAVLLTVGGAIGVGAALAAELVRH